ncbi:MAG: type II CRISPR RNA-guided endonuclease Cas9 [Bacteroidales bacterium]|uniref:type II CRISPR RNA-guided endonuclease Cas9 n=1 Tax=Candidatus Cryptobacteroides sp. TaxID=2952915 RepID=UPI002A75184E|nr:type II CRISPR RNA-guided endonuclease Cas9 [Candidatus Cryptobacteroides sp.]MDD7235552.1 type II CRISPR RNA-guided endonuclease Cas9 [Bacteroidales bacterium]MDY2702114.1 type II CRISPR RNA-guided endonuclease Cas9 [Candidatus Cryptobacteroides sp.]
MKTKRILGLDLGTSSIGWALVDEAEVGEKSSVVKLGVRIIQYDTFTNGEGQEINGNPADYFSAGKTVTPNAARTKSRSMRRNLQRYKLRRKMLIETLKKYNIINDSTLINESGPASTYSTLSLRAKAAVEEISLEDLARVLVNINKKRGYKSSRKAGSSEDGNLVDGMSIARKLYDKGITPGQYVFGILRSGKYFIPDFYRSDLEEEFDRVWKKQSEYYPELLTDDLRESLRGKNNSQTGTICQELFNIVGVKRNQKGRELVTDNYRLRSVAIDSKISLEELAIVLQEINGQIKNSSGYLGGISDRSKFLHFNNLTVGQWQMKQLDANRHFSLKNQTFFRQDYLDEFERIWSVQSAYHPELTPELKKILRDIVIFYQRPLRSQKGLVGICEFENRVINTVEEGREKTRRIGLKVCPKSSPLFQEFKMWQVINNLKVNGRELEQEQKEMLAEELSIRGRMSDKDVLKVLFKNPKDLSLNFKSVEGNGTMAALYSAYSRIIAATGHQEYDFSKMPAADAKEIVSRIFSALGWKTDFLTFDSSLPNPDYECQPVFRLWHLLYSYEGDKSVSGNASLIKYVSEITGMEEEYARILTGLTFSPDYGSLSSKAMRKILPFMKDGNEYSLACEYAGYRHSAKSLTKEELANREYSDAISLLPKNSLRNPMVEKILNQMANVVNEVIATYGKPDEVRIELARDLKKSAEERKEMTEAITKSTAEYDGYRKTLKEEFGIDNPSRNDLIRYRLYMELKDNGYHTLYSNTYIPREKLFSKEFDIEHIIPQAKLFDDSFANKTLEARQINIEKSNKTAYDFVSDKYGEGYLAEYQSRIERLCKNGSISRTKKAKLLMREEDIPQGFIERDLRDTQYISRKAKEMLEEIVPYVVSTTGSITDRLREDWQLVDVMRELNWEKYDKLGMTYYVTDSDGRRIPKIKDWTKRNDHRHHAMDALTIAFTRRSYIQYLNNLNARIPKSAFENTNPVLEDYGISDIPKNQRTSVVMSVELNQMYRDSKGRLRFIPPMPIDEFRQVAKAKMEEILVSMKTKGKVVTRNTNITKKRGGINRKAQLTPRGQLHNETVYGRIVLPVFKEEKVGSGFDYAKIATVVSQSHRNALKSRLEAFGGDPKKAFTGKNSFEKNPLYVDQAHSETVPLKVETVSYQVQYTKREAVGPDLKVDKVIDKKIQEVLLARLYEFGGDAKKAFVNLDENPIWLNQEKGIAIKRVTITGKDDVEPLHCKRDNTGSLILDDEGKPIPTDYISTSNNHHVAIYRDADGNLQEQVVSLLEAVTRVNLGVPVIDRDYKRDAGWTFLFSMRKNEFFVFPDPKTGFDPADYDLMDVANYPLISKHLFRVQKCSSKDYVFRHHLETTVTNKDSSLRNITWKRIKSPNGLRGATKVRINHLGNIVHIGE